MALRVAADDEQQFTMHAVVDTHRRFTDLSVVYTNDPVWVEHSIHIMELLLAKEKYKCWKYALEAIINGYYYISLFMVIVYCSSYNCVIRKS